MNVNKNCNLSHQTTRKWDYKLETKTQKANDQPVWYESKIQEGRTQGTRKTMEERICETDEFEVWSED